MMSVATLIFELMNITFTRLSTLGVGNKIPRDRDDVGLLLVNQTNHTYQPIQGDPCP
jgi:hypothetical protein